MKTYTVKFKNGQWFKIEGWKKFTDYINMLETGLEELVSVSVE